MERTDQRQRDHFRVLVVSTMSLEADEEIDLLYDAITSDMDYGNYSDAVNYLEYKFDYDRQHHMQVKAALKRAFDVPMFLPPSKEQATQVRTIRTLMTLAEHQEGLTHNFTIYVLNRYILEILKTRQGQDSVVDNPAFGAVVLERAKQMDLEVDGVYDRVPAFAKCKVHRRILDSTRATCKEISELFQSLYRPEWVQAKAKEFTYTVGEELMAKACHPNRVQWWMDTEEYKEIFG